MTAWNSLWKVELGVMKEAGAPPLLELICSLRLAAWGWGGPEYLALSSCRRALPCWAGGGGKGWVCRGSYCCRWDLVNFCDYVFLSFLSAPRENCRDSNFIYMYISPINHSFSWGEGLLSTLHCHSGNLSHFPCNADLRQSAPFYLKAETLLIF